MKRLRRVRADRLEIGDVIGFWDPFRNGIGFHKSEVVELREAENRIRVYTRDGSIFVHFRNDNILVIGEHGEPLL